MLNINKFLLCLTFALFAACSSNTPIQSGVDNTGGETKEATSETVVAQNNINPNDQMVCKVRPITGSRFKQKTCMTAKEWENMAHESKGMVDKATRNKVRYTD